MQTGYFIEVGQIENRETEPHFVIASFIKNAFRKGINNTPVRCSWDAGGWTVAMHTRDMYSLFYNAGD
jgi:hypothetical protein